MKDALIQYANCEYSPQGVLVDLHTPRLVLVMGIMRYRALLWCTSDYGMDSSFGLIRTPEPPQTGAPGRASRDDATVCVAAAEANRGSAVFKLIKF
jgi:hypothetical protein